MFAVFFREQAWSRLRVLLRACKRTVNTAWRVKHFYRLWTLSASSEGSDDDAMGRARERKGRARESD